MRREPGAGRKPDEPDDGRPVSRQLDEERTGQRAGTPAGLIRRPMKVPAMERIQGDGERAA